MHLDLLEDDGVLLLAPVGHLQARCQVVHIALPALLARAPRNGQRDGVPVHAVHVTCNEGKEAMGGKKKDKEGLERERRGRELITSRV